MTTEHADLEADWLYGELERAQDYARKAYQANDEKNQRLYLTYVISTLDGLFNHYKLDVAPPKPDPTEISEADRQRLRPVGIKQRRGLWAWLVGN